MAVEADSVVVSLIADTKGFDSTMKQSAAAFVDSSRQVAGAAGDVEKAADGVYTAHNKMGLATNNARIAQFELEHVIRGSVDSYASGAGAAQILAQHIASVAEAATFMGGSLGAVGEVLSGPWGIAITAAIALGAGLLAKHKEENETLDTAVDKLKKHHDATVLQNQADQIWSHTIDGLIDRLNRLNEATGKKLQLPNLVNQQSFSDAQAKVDSLNRLIDKTEADPTSTLEQINKLYEALADAVTNLRQQTSVLGQQVGEVFSDLTKKADDWSQYQQNKIRFLTGSHPELLADTGKIQAAFEVLKKAVDDAAKAGVPFDAFTKRVDALNQRLADSPSSINSYISGLKQIGVELEKIASLKPEDAIKKFQSSIIGAEGTGANRLGSSAAGFGQFMPATFEHYYKQAYGDPGNLSNEQIDALRNNRTVAEGVIDAATKDYVSILEHAGQQITAASLYTVHLLSSGDPHGTVALRLLNAPAGEDMRQVLGKNYAADVRGNPFLAGTAGDARSSIAKRIGDSDSTISAGSAAITKNLEDQDKLWSRLEDHFNSEEFKQEQINVLKGHEVDLTKDVLSGHEAIDELLNDPAIKKWAAQMEASLKEFASFGDHELETLFNPDNWKNWGDLGKQVLHDLELEILKLGALNPLKNLLNPSENNPTLGSVFSVLGLFSGKGGGSGAGFVPGGTGSFTGAFASGGSVNGAGTGTSDSIPARLSNGEYVMSADAVKRIGVSTLDAMNNGRGFADGGLVRPSNASAIPPSMGSNGPGGNIYISVDAKDAVLAQTVQGWIAAGMAQAANGGSVLARRGLNRSAMHRLD